MDLLTIIVSIATPFTIAFLALVIVREGQNERSTENARRDVRQDSQDKQRTQDNQQFMLLFATLTGKQGELQRAVERSERSVNKKVETSADDTTQSLEDFKDLFIMTIDMMMEDPRATRERIKRMQKAWAEGDMNKAQAVADETQPTAESVVT